MKELFQEGVAIMFKGTHYGEEVWMDWLNENEYGLNQIIKTLKRNNSEYKLLPICDEEHNYDVLKYNKDGEDKYCIICDTQKCYFMMRKLPEDMNIMKLILDIMEQKNGKEPMVMCSKYREVIDPVLLEAQRLIENTEELPELEKVTLELFKRKAEDTLSDKEKTFDNEDLEELVLVERKAKFSYMYKVAADILKEKGYSYEYLKTIAELDHHDTDFWKSELDSFFEGYYYYSILRKYREC